ncbi:MAG: hypothetical protein FJ356_03110 [Thaumarchaeota archaeon]|nr:hypothetical protein [Nitrososphaerota archaeon]
MTLDGSVDKDRLYFTQCNDTIVLRCPICTEEKKVLIHCKLHKNFPSLWWHVRNEHKDIPPSQLEEIIQILTGLFKAFKHQMFPKWAYTEQKVTTTTSSLLFDGKPPRIDSLQKLQEIARLYKQQSQSYPHLTHKQVTNWASVILGKVDTRTLKKYLDCIIHNSKKDAINGVYDVSEFCNILGV